MEFLKFLSEDWKKIPQNLRYLILAGGFLMFNSWLLDHWGENEPYLLWWKLDIRVFGYSLGFTLIMLCFSLLVLKQFFYFGRVIWYRKKYSIEKLDKDFHLIWFKGKLILFDVGKEMYYHVFPWGTAQDLLFVGRGEKIPKSFDAVLTQKEDISVGNTGKTIKIKSYKNGGGINTQI